MKHLLLKAILKFCTNKKLFKKKGLHFDSISDFAISLLKSWRVLQWKEQGKNVKLGCSRYNSIQLWLKVSAYVFEKSSAIRINRGP